MEKFEQLSALPIPGNYSKAFESKEGRWVLLDTRTCDSVEAANQALKTALHLQLARSFALPLLFPFLSDTCTLTFVWELPADYAPLLSVDWTYTWQPGKTGYRTHKVKYSSSGVKVAEGRSPSQAVLLKTYRGLSVAELNEGLREVFTLAQLDHPHVCRLLDLCVYERRGYCLRCVFAAGDTDLERLSEERSEQYSETELWTLLEQAAEGLAYVKQRAHFAHRCLKPSCLLLSADLRLQVSDFSPWRADTQSAFLSPEVAMALHSARRYDPFRADIYSLALTFARLAALRVLCAGPQVAAEVEALNYSRELKDLLQAMLRDLPHQRPSLEDVLAVVHKAKPQTAVAVSIPTEQSLLLCVQRTQVKSFDFSRRVWTVTELPAPIPVDESGTRYVWMDLGLFCCGGTKHVGWEELGRQAFILGRDWELLQVADMTTARSAQGLWWDAQRRRVLALGGVNSTVHVGVSEAPLAACEELCLEEGEWQELLGMREGRGYFHPCAWQGVLYLCGQGSSAIEAFDLAASTFFDVRATLPESGVSLSVVDCGQLVVISSKFVTRWQVCADGLEQVEDLTHPDIDVFSSMAPVVDSLNGLVYAAALGLCFSVSLQGERQEVAS